MERLQNWKLQRIIAVLMALLLAASCLTAQNSDILTLTNQTGETNSRGAAMLCSVGALGSIDYYCSEKPHAERIETRDNTARRSLFATLALFCGTATTQTACFHNTCLRDLVHRKISL